MKKLRTLVRLGTGLLVAVATSAVLHATMTSHGAYFYGDAGGFVCEAWIDPGEDTGAVAYMRRVTISIKGPSGDVLDWDAYGAGNNTEPVYANVQVAYVGPGTYSCHVQFQEDRDYNYFVEGQFDYFDDSIEL
jgi:hypothetical protein